MVVAVKWGLKTPSPALIGIVFPIIDLPTILRCGSADLAGTNLPAFTAERAALNCSWDGVSEWDGSCPL